MQHEVQNYFYRYTKRANDETCCILLFVTMDEGIHCSCFGAASILAQLLLIKSMPIQFNARIIKEQ